MYNKHPKQGLHSGAADFASVMLCGHWLSTSVLRFVHIIKCKHLLYQKHKVHSCLDIGLNSDSTYSVMPNQ